MGVFYCLKEGQIMLPLFLSLVVLLCAGTDLYAKPPSDAQPEIVEIIGDIETGSTTNVTLYTVPANKQLVITDVVIVAGTGTGVITRNGAPVSVVSFSNDTMYQQTYSTGIEFKAGDQVGVEGNGNIFYEFRGLLDDAP